MNEIGQVKNIVLESANKNSWDNNYHFDNNKNEISDKKLFYFIR